MKYLALIVLAVLGCVELILRVACVIALILTVFGFFVVENKLDLLDCVCFTLAERLAA